MKKNYVGFRVDMNGVSFQRNEHHVNIEITSFTEDLKEIIRKYLSQICHGECQASRGRLTYNYKTTLATFLDRYKNKPINLQIGMMGELLTHLLILELLPDFKTSSIYFNSEEKQIKKGFDILLYSESDSEVWITEVKSGGLHKGKTVNQTTRNLLALARRDLKTRLNENELNHWQNAIHSARIAIKDERDYKNVVISLLEDEGDTTCLQQATSSDNNVFLVSSLFTPSDEKVNEDTLNKFYEDDQRAAFFKKTFLLSIKKETYTQVVNFFETEVASE